MLPKTIASVGQVCLARRDNLAVTDLPVFLLRLNLGVH